jgi:adenosyl cobinamide kinase/adenosyl cobinamide phosphate guanylyltransferase
MTSPIREPEYRRAVTSRLNQLGAETDPAFLDALDRFVRPGLERVEEGEATQEQFDQALRELTEALAQSLQLTSTGSITISASVFGGIRDRLCPGFWPFC